MQQNEKPRCYERLDTIWDRIFRWNSFDHYQSSARYTVYADQIRCDNHAYDPDPFLDMINRHARKLQQILTTRIALQKKRATLADQRSRFIYHRANLVHKCHNAWIVIGIIAVSATRTRKIRTAAVKRAATSCKRAAMTLPILYSFRRCPYAMRARLALIISGVTVELREVALRAKPAAMLRVSPKGTVPVLVLPDHRVIDESLDIMRWAASQNIGDGMALMALDDDALVTVIDGAFKHHLDRYKYADRYPDDPIDHRAEATDLLRLLDARLCRRVASGGEWLALADVAILPFVRQFAEVDRGYFDRLPLVALQRWLADFLASALFERAMVRFAPWRPGDPPILFPAHPSA